MEFWNHIYDHFDPVAFNLFSIPVHWYGIMYVLALLGALFAAKWMIKRDKTKMTQSQLDDYFIYIEVGIILGARLGYILFYDPNTLYYLSQPWQMFNPYQNGEFVGIRGMSYHGAVIGWFLGSLLYYKRHKEISFGEIMDVVALAVPIGYIFGRVGNFLNKEIIGRTTEMPWAIYVDGVMRHPSQLYEAFLEGFMVFMIIFVYRRWKHFNGALILMYGFAYGWMRFIAEFWREPDPQLGFICCGWMTMGQLLSVMMIMAAVVIGLLVNKRVIQTKR
ncbi:MAG: prolipoprotein diacylglyceryl transferase [Campylobacterota bacterium]|nr:prolipoprotein diacylglyceryl transferase [Campylobacterota bacterium]